MKRKTGLLRGSGLAWLLVTVGVLGWVSAAHAVERQFLGIRMLSRVQTVLARFGNPNQVTVGQVAYNLPGQQQAGMMGAPGAPGRVGMAGVPGMPGMPGAPGLGGMGPLPGAPASGFGGMPPMMGAGAMTGGPGMMGRGSFGGDLDGEEMAMMGGPRMGAPATGAPGLPGLPGGVGMPRPGMGMAPGTPPMYGAPGMAGMTGTPGGVGLPSVGLRTTPGGMMVEQETTLIYERPGGVIYEFLVNKDGLVVQAKAIGYEDKSGLARTARGIRLGDSYQKVVAAYGWPREHQNLGATLYVSYPNHHVAFQFYDNKVVSIIVAAMEK